ncbi:AAA family ATPase [Amycolatopsis lurida]|nr:ATP-binding protein [Amycolatopsis lurida]
MVAVDRERAAARAVSGLGESLLTVAGIFGPNASGKSSVLGAMAHLRRAVAESFPAREEASLMQPFTLPRDGARVGEFVVEMTVAGVRFEYRVTLESGQVQYEGLFHYPERKRRRLFERRGSELTLARGLGTLAVARDLLAPQVLVLSIARQVGPSLVGDFAEELLSIQVWNASDDGYAAECWREAGGAAIALALMKLVDPDVDEILVDQPAAAEGSSGVAIVRRGSGRSMVCEVVDESGGVRRWFSVVPSVVAALTSGAVVVADDLDAGIHPLVVAELVRVFGDRVANPKGAQLVFASARTGLLNQLNRDEVWFTEKSEEGVTRLGSLAEFAGERVRKSENVERSYLAGRFGALPEVGGMARELGSVVDV